LAIYAADIQINVKNKGDLRTLESRFKKIETAAVSLSKTLKGLGRRNAIKVDTRAAMSAISALEARIRGLNRTVNLDARTRESRSGGGGGGAAIPLAAAAFGGGMGRRGMDSFERITKKQMDYVDQRIAQIEQKFDTRAASATNPVAAKMETLKNRRRVLGDEARAIQNDFQTRLKQQSFRQLRRDIAASEGRYQDLLASPPPPASRTKTPWGSRAEGLTAKVRKQWTDELRAERGFGNKLKAQIPAAMDAGAGPARQIEDKLGKINELARQQANLKKVAEGENRVTQARVKGNAVRGKVRTLEDKIEQSQVNVARSQSKGEKISEDLAAARSKQEQALKKLTTTQKTFNTRQGKQRSLLQLEKDLATATKARSKAQQDLNKWNKAQQNQIDRYGPNNIRRDFAKPGGAIDKSTNALKEANKQVDQIQQKLSKTGRVADFSKPLNNAKQAFKGVKAEADALGQALDRNNRRLAQGNQILNRRTGIQKRQKFMGAAGRGAAASMALIPGVAPLAVGGFAGAAGGGGMAGGAIGVAIAGAVTGATAFLEFAKSATVVASEMDRMRTALSGVVPDQESYNTSIEKVTKLSNKYGISQRTLLKGFTQLQASADAAGFGVEDTGNLMEGLLARTLASGKGLEEFKGVMLAASQILSKGKLQAEEARGQIGERIPGFMADLAASMNISMKELDKAMEQGEVTLKDFFKLGEDLLKNNEEIAKRMANSYANAGQRLTTAMENLQAAMGPGLSIAGAQFQNFAAGVINGLTEMAKSANAKELERLEKILERMNKGGIQGKLMEWTHGSKDKIEEQRSIISGEKSIDERAKREKAKAAAEEEANWKKIKDRLEIDTKFQKDRISLGQKEAEIQRELAEMKLQFPDKDLDEIEKRIRALKDLEDQTVSNSVAFKELQESAAQRLKDLQNPINQLKTITEAFEDSFSNAIREVVRGTKSIGDAVASMLNRIADAFIQNAADMAAAAASNALMKFIGKSLFSGIDTGGATPTHTLTSSGGSSTTFYTGGSGTLDYAKGGYVDRPTNAIIGEGGEGEYIIPESKLASSLSRFQAGHRGNSVVPNGRDGGGASGGGSGEVTVNYTGPTLNFNGDEYVPRSAVPQIINSAAMAGATAGRANTMKDLKNSRSQRSRLGL
jgi:tape measure domain-containing protein